jgi:hypothetical protein
MPDSTTIIKQIVFDTLSLDSINFKLTALQQSLSKGSANPTFSIWIPLLAAVVGGLLVWGGQAIERNRRRNLEKRNSLLEIYAYCRKLEAEMKNNYRELALAKSHIEYWWFCCNSSSTAIMPRYYEEHLRSQSYAREIERRIGDTKAVFIGHIHKFQAISPFKGNISEHIDIISDLTNAKAKSYDFDLPHDKVRNELYDQDEKELRETYYKNLLPFKTVNDILQIHVTKKANA